MASLASLELTIFMLLLFVSLFDSIRITVRYSTVGNQIVSVHAITLMVGVEVKNESRKSGSPSGTSHDTVISFLPSRRQTSNSWYRARQTT